VLRPYIYAPINKPFSQARGSARTWSRLVTYNVRAVEVFVFHPSLPVDLRF